MARQASYSTDSASNRLLGISSSAGSRSFGYDSVGHLLQDQRGGITDCHRYDALHRTQRIERHAGSVSCASASGNTVGEYRFNGLNQRSMKIAGGVSTRFVYGPAGELLYEVSSSGALAGGRAYVWFDGRLVALGQGGEALAVHDDHLGRPRRVLDGSGATRWSAKTLGFDRSVSSDAIGGLGLGFAGQYYDAESGLWQNWHRTYDGTVGRYTQSDPIGLAGGINTYAYVDGNPVGRIDPYGLYCLSERQIGAIGGAVGGAFSGIISGLQAGNPAAAVSLGVLGGSIGGVMGYAGSGTADGAAVGGAAAAGTSTTDIKSGSVGGAVSGLIAYDLARGGMRDSQAAIVGGGVGGAVGGFAAGFLSSKAIKSALNSGLGGLAGAALGSAIVEALRAGNNCGCGK